MRRRVEPIACALVLALAPAACRRHETSVSKPSPSASARLPTPKTASAPASGTRCSPVHSASGATAGFRVGDSAAARKDEPPDAESDEAAEPFAVEIGSAAAFHDGFAVGVLTLVGRSRAAIALLDRDGRAGKTLDLGATHGGQDAPRVAASGDSIVAAVPDSDASGRVLRLAQVRGALATPSVVWGADRPAAALHSEVFAIELTGDRGLLVWDGTQRGSERGAVRGAAFRVGDIAKATPTRVLSPEASDAAMPALAPRPGGFWLAWVIEEPESAKPARPSASHRSETDPNAPLNDLGPRRIELVPLDADAERTATPIAITPPGSSVLAYDLAPLPGGGVLVAWRDGGSSPRAEIGSVHWATVSGDGSVQRSELDASAVGTGVPALLVDAEATPPRAALWVSLDDAGGRALLAAAGTNAALLDVLAPEPAIGRADPLAVAGGHLLIARPEHLGVELSVLECHPGPPPSAAPAASASSGPESDDIDPGLVDIEGR